MSKFATKTTVSPEKSRAEIESTLKRYGADQFGYAMGLDRAVVAFRCAGRMVRFELPLPGRQDKAITHKKDRYGYWEERTDAQKLAAYDQELRQRWRALALCVKAKLEAVDSRIASFDSEFLAYLVLPGGRTVGDEAIPRIAQAYESGQLPNLLPMLDNHDA